MAKKFVYFKKQASEIDDIRKTVNALEKISAANVHNLKTTSQIMKNYEIALKKIFYGMEYEQISNPLLVNSYDGKKLKVVLSAEKGLCGDLLNRLADFVESNLEKGDEVLVVGEKGRKLLEERGIGIDYFFNAPDDIPTEMDIKKIKDFIISQFVNGKFSSVSIFYPEFETLAVQKPVLLSFLPLDRGKFIQDLGNDAEEVEGFPIYEPSQKEIMNYLVKEYLGIGFYQNVLETKLSELSARTLAMEEAGENSQEIINRLSHLYFRAKREAATKEINDLYSHRAFGSRFL